MGTRTGRRPRITLMIKNKKSSLRPLSTAVLRTIAGGPIVIFDLGVTPVQLPSPFQIERP